ncbi:MAG: ABC-F family ATP-binding cassette domain-containing protein [Flavobacteriia bacterium]|nr:ABC-F family ATP-binding cassette domain-containing protein [Flavobacteriia bacterium]
MINLEKLGYFLPQGYLFRQVSLQINKSDKVGLVGKNGAGKSTLLKILSGKTKPSEGNVHLPKGTVMGYLTQDIVIDSEQSVFEYLNCSNERIDFIRKRLDEINIELTTRSDYDSEYYAELLDELAEKNHEFQVIEGFQWEEKIMNALNGLGFNDKEIHNSLNTFSGGWKMRAELARILVNQPDILLLDEPTNHLDILSIGWLETYLQRFDGVVIIISHDRFFLDNVTKRTLEISMNKIFDFPYGYSKYKLMREEEMGRLEQAKKQQDKEIKHTEELINKFRAKQSKAAFAQSLIKKLDKTERIEIEKESYSGIRISFPLSIQPGKWVLEMNNLGKSYGEKVLFKNVNLTIGRGEKIALLGPNGVGKSTLLKAIMRSIDFEGTVTNGHNVNLAYFAQDQAEKLDPSLSVYETVDHIAKGELRKNLRTILGAFLFSGEIVEKKVSVLSGGERTRLALCQLLLSPSNFIILDEPTNHLDMQSKEILKSALLNYEGTFIVVSHDREFLEGLTNRIWDIEKESLIIHHFTLNEYLLYKNESKLKNEGKLLSQTEKVKAPKIVKEKVITSSVDKEIKTIEKKIELAENELLEINDLLSKLSYGDVEFDTTAERYNSKKAVLAKLVEEWETILIKHN